MDRFLSVENAITDMTTTTGRHPEDRTGRVQVRVEQDRTERVQFLNYDQQWNKRCNYCGYMHLNSATESMLRNCCDNGVKFYDKYRYKKDHITLSMYIISIIYLYIAVQDILFRNDMSEKSADTKPVSGCDASADVCRTDICPEDSRTFVWISIG